ncbi:MAG: hypothetical protein K5929_08410, partial [Lachnospiraceae bacterium]|nr:hypothetical protein [Lachnospiraceae bacterium]
MKEGRRILGIVLALALVFTTVLQVPGVGGAETVFAKAKTTVVVKTQKELNKALKSKKAKIIIVKSKAKKLSIKKGNYSGKTLVVNSAKTTLDNAGSFKALNIKKAATFIEKAKNNNIKVADKKLNVGVTKTAKDVKLTVSKKNAVVSMDIAGTVSDINVKNSGAKVTVNLNGTLAKAEVNAASELLIAGNSGTAVSVALNADGATLKTAVKTDVDVNAKANVTFEKGAEDSTVTSKTAGAEAKVTNNT